MPSRETGLFKRKVDRTKVKVAELIGETELLQQKQMIQNEVNKLKITEQLSNAKARIKQIPTQSLKVVMKDSRFNPDYWKIIR